MDEQTVLNSDGQQFYQYEENEKTTSHFIEH